MQDAPDLVTFSRTEASEHFEDLYHHVAYGGARKVPLPASVLGHYRLPPGSVFVAVPTVTQPFAFPVGNLGDGAHGGRGLVVIARELGDLTYPLMLANQRRQVSADVKQIAARVCGDVLDWCTPQWRMSHRAGRIHA